MLAALSLASGFSGLVYEVLWAKELGLLFGGTAAAQMVVLSCFLGGLAAGNWALGRRADLGEPMTLYGRLELGIAALGLSAPLFFRAAAWAFPARYPLGALAVFVPCFLMGGTIPALARAAGPRRGEGLERSVASVYFWNCLGAVGGALAAGYLLLARLGLDGTAVTAACVNAICGIAGCRFKRSPAPSSPAKEASDAAFTPLPAVVVYEAAFLSGLVSLAYETGWVRLLTLVLGGSSYSFCAMLSGFIAGIALGSLLVSATRLGRMRPDVLFGWAQLGVAAAVLICLPLYERLPWIFRLINGRISRGPWGFVEFEAVKFAFCFALMVPATALIGMTLPLMSRLAVDDGEVGAGVGRVFAANTAGNVVGAAAAYLVLPAIGLEAMLRAATTVSAAVGAGVLALTLPWSRGARWAVVSVAALGLLGYRAAVPSWNRAMLSLGDYRGHARWLPFNFRQYRDGVLAEMRLASIEDGPEATVTIMEGRDKFLGTTVLKINGKTEASNSGDMATQILCAELPLILRPDSRDVLVVGLGSGITAGSALRHRLVRRLDVVEISRAVAHAAAFFRKENGAVLEDPRAHLTIADAKAFLRRPGGPDYDLVISEPSNPWMAGVANLFTSDFYADVRRRLRPGGIMMQWFHVYEMDDDDFRLVLRTFASSFKHVTVWNVHDADALLLGSDEPLAPDWRRADRDILAKPVFDDFNRAGLHTVAALLSLQTASDETARAMAGSGPLNRDRRPLLEYSAPVAYFRGDSSDLIDREDDRVASPERRSRLLLASYRAARPPLRAIEYMDVVSVRHSTAERRVLGSFLEEWSRAYPRDERALAGLILYYTKIGRREIALERLKRLKKMNPARPDLPKLEAELRKRT